MLTKIFLLVVVIAFVWFGWRWVKRVQTIGREKLAGRNNDGRAPAANAGAGAPPNPPPGRDQMGRDQTRRDQAGKSAEDMEKCAECGAYVAPRLSGPCGRPGCPYG